MGNKFYFISGLPRSGSTLLSSILRQNPRFYANISSPLMEMANKLKEPIKPHKATTTLLSEEQKNDLLRGVFYSYAKSLNKEVIFDTNRGWTGNIAYAKQLFPYTKVICCVRDMPWILDSIERIVNENTMGTCASFPPGFNVNNVYSRAEWFMKEGNLIGSAYVALKSAYYGANKDMLMLVTYESLAQEPELTMKAIYNFIDQPYYNHDFNDVEFSSPEYDKRLGLKGLHDVKKKVEFKPRQLALPPDIIMKYKDMAFWRSQNQKNDKQVDLPLTNEQQYEHAWEEVEPVCNLDMISNVTALGNK